MRVSDMALLLHSRREIVAWMFILDIRESLLFMSKREVTFWGYLKCFVTRQRRLCIFTIFKLCCFLIRNRISVFAFLNNTTLSKQALDVCTINGYGVETTSANKLILINE